MKPLSLTAASVTGRTSPITWRIQGERGGEIPFDPASGIFVSGGADTLAISILTDRSRARWLDEHRAFLGRAAAIGGFSMNDQIETVFERFVVVWPPELADGQG